jgi:hypothetical protein
MRSAKGIYFFDTRRPAPASNAGVLQAWEYRDPAVVVEIREERAEEMLAADAARAQADREIECARRAQAYPLSPITARLLKRLRIRELLKTAKGGA